ncbi:hypothetical protein AAF712_014481 [Marasmius tenuissimus]|uniref:SWIM-type domain-containing protein n=1 Tax=Marasmius tenuissimus TaxID=585030 RepID=A0ABR2ZAZ2_9AGAR
MSDKDLGQLNAIARWYPESRRLLCWWHVLHAWQQHFVVQHYEELWRLLQKWIRIAGKEEFQAAWEQVQKLAPLSLVEYFRVYWLPDVEMWSAVFRRDRTVFELSDTNKLVEAYSCTCLSFPLIRFCKHIAAVQRHFPESFTPVPPALLVDSHPDSLPTLDNAQTNHQVDTPVAAGTLPEVFNSQVITKLSSLELLLRTRPPGVITDNFRDFYEHLSNFTSQLNNMDSLLPHEKKIAPNQHSWPETRDVMNVPVKSKRKSAHSDPYAGGERSGKKAKKDARGSQTLTVPPPAVSPPAPTLIPTPAASSGSVLTQTLIPLDPAQFNLSDTQMLSSLRRQELNILCRYYGVKCKGTNEDLIAQLQGKIVPTNPPVPN